MPTNPYPNWAGDPNYIPFPRQWHESKAPWQQQSYQTLNRDQEILNELQAIRQHLEALKPKPSLILTGQQVVNEYEHLTRNSGDG